MSLNNISLRYKLIIFLVVAEIVILSSFSIITIYGVYEHRELQIYDDSFDLLNSYAEDINSQVSNTGVSAYVLSLQFESKIINGQEYFNQESINQIMSKTLKSSPFISSTFIVLNTSPVNFCENSENKLNYFDHFISGCFYDESGNIMFLSSDNYDLSYGLSEYSLSENNFSEYSLSENNFSEYLQLGEGAIKKELSSSFYNNNVSVMRFTSPVYSEDTFSGVCGIEISLENIGDYINQLSFLESGYAVLMDKNGNFISHSESQSINGISSISSLYNLDESNSYNQFDNLNSTGFLKTSDPFSGVDSVVFYKPVIDDSAFLLMFIPEKEIIKNANDMSFNIFITFLIAIIILILITYLISFFIFSPIDEVVKDIDYVSKNIEKGNLNVRADTNTNIDIRPIPVGLNKIIDVVSLQVNETKNFAHSLEKGNLNARVESEFKGEFRETGDALSNFSSSLQNIIYDSTQVLISFQNNDFTREVRFYGEGDFKHLTEGIEHTRLELLRMTEEYKESERALIKHTQILQESKEKAQYMEKIINNSPVVAFLVKIDRGWPLLYISENIIQWGYSLKDFKTGLITFFDLVYRKDRSHLFNRITEYFYGNKNNLFEEYRIMTKTGEIRWVECRMHFIRGEGKFVDLQGIALDITERKNAEERLLKTDELRKKEIHHRIKNNLQVISTMLYLESSKFTDKEVLKAFADSQARVKSMALIHEELYKSDSPDLQQVNFKSYIEKLVDSLFKSYKTGDNIINIKVSALNINLGIDTATPLGTIVNELITNSLKYAFPDGRDGNIWIVMNRIKKGDQEIIDMEIGDDGISDPEDFEKENGQSLGLQLVFALVEQINGTITMDFNEGTKYHIYFPVESEEEESGRNLFE